MTFAGWGGAGMTELGWEQKLDELERVVRELRDTVEATVARNEEIGRLLSKRRVRSAELSRHSRNHSEASPRKVTASIGDTMWTVGEDGVLRATFGEGDEAIHGTLIGVRPGTDDRIALILMRGDRTLLDEGFDDLAAAMEAVTVAVERAWIAHRGC